MRYRLRPVTEQDKEWLYALKIDAYRDVVERQFGWWDEDLQRRMFEDAWQPAAARVIVVSGRDVGLLELANREGTLWIAEHSTEQHGARSGAWFSNHSGSHG